MADTDQSRPQRGRIRTLTQAALNADVTVSQVDALLVDMADTLEIMSRLTTQLDTTMGRFNDTITKIDELAPRMNGVVDRMEAIVVRVENIVSLAETLISPISATENAVRGLFTSLRRIAE